jgi:hypothetical protein
MTELAAADPTERARELIRLTARLTELIEEETGHFERREPHKAVDLQVEKTRLGSIYRRETQLAARDPSRLSGLDAALGGKLRETVIAFEAALARNGRVVEALKVITEGLVKAIADEAARQTAAEGGYGPGALQSARIGAMAVSQSA